MFEPEIGGQNHDRMETDEESDDSNSEADTSQSGETPASNGGADVTTADPEAMDTTPDDLGPGEAGPSWNPGTQEAIYEHGVELEGQPSVSAATATFHGDAGESGGHAVASLGNTSIGGPATDSDNHTAIGNNPESTQSAEQQGSSFPSETVPPDGQVTIAAGEQADSSGAADLTTTDIAPPGSPPPVHPSEANRNRERDDEEEQPYWASFEEDKSVPSEEELKIIEQQPVELDALNHDHWEKLAFESLDDPEYVPSAAGRISWTMKGFHGTQSKPNREKIMRSPSVLIDGYYWNIKVYPRGNEGTPLMSVYVECSTLPNQRLIADPTDKGQANEVSKTGDEPVSYTTNNENTSAPNLANASIPTALTLHESDGNESHQPTSTKEVSQPNKRWEVPAQILCVAYNPEEPRVLAYDRTDHRFHDESPDWGWRRFHGPWNKLHIRERLQRQALLRNDTLCFTAYIRTIKDDTGALFWHAPAGKPQWDHYERLGLNRMLAGSAGSSAAVSALSTWLHLYPVSPSIKKMGMDLEENYRERPLFDELEHWRQEFISSSKELTHDINFESSVEMVDWYNTGDCEPDVVAFWETLRRILSFEASDVKSIAEARDYFEDILLLKQPDVGKQIHDAEPQVPGQAEDVALRQLTEPCSVQEAVDLASTYETKDDRVWKTFDGHIHSLAEPPSILQVELHRQKYDTSSRKWEKLTHCIKIDERVTFGSRSLGPDQGYTLFGLVVHSGSLESKDYCSILRPQGPGTRWIKFAGDKAGRGVECLTTKQALTAHEGGNHVENTSAVAYIVTYVRNDLLPQLAVGSKSDGDSTKSPPDAPKNGVGPTNEPMDQDEVEDVLTVYVYQADLFEGHSNPGVFDWCERGPEDARVLKIDVTSEITPAGIVDAIVKSRKEQFPDRQEKYAMWFMNSLLNNAAMDSVMRAPQVIPLTDRATDELMRVSGIFYGPCRVWLHVMPSKMEKENESDSTMSEASAILTAPIVEEIMQNDGNLSAPTNEQDSDRDPASTTEATSTSGPATNNEPARSTTDTSSDEAPTPEAPTAEDGDVAMGSSADVEAESIPPPPAKPTWNSHLDTQTLRNKDNVYIFLKFFDQDAQTLRGVRCFFTKSTEKVGDKLRSALSLADDQPIDVYEEKVSSLIRPVSTDSQFLDIAALSTYILIAQRRPSQQELTHLKQAGKPPTVPAYYEYLFAANDPSYLRPHLTTSYFSTPYYSGALCYGRPHGHGTSISLSGDAYTGTFASGLKSGHGTMRYANGDTYIGSWANDEPEGEGEMVYAKTGNVYTGGFKKRKRHGKGVMRFEVADEEMRLCQICYEEEMDALFYDCGHVAACETCARQVEDCPVCRRRVKAVVRIWMS